MLCRVSVVPRNVFDVTRPRNFPLYALFAVSANRNTALLKVRPFAGYAAAHARFRVIRVIRGVREVKYCVAESWSSSQARNEGEWCQSIPLDEANSEPLSDCQLQNRAQTESTVCLHLLT